MVIKKYKDDFPANTINKIKNILYTIGISTIETNWKNSMEGFNSLSVEIKDTDLSTNGKGYTPMYAVASAYAELMERLQNQTFFRLSMDLSEELLRYEGFYYAPDEKYVNKKQLLNSDEDWIKIQMSKMNFKVKIDDILRKWQYISYEKTPSDFITLPYLNLKNNKISHIPVKMVSKMYMSNGMCAGNTREEALVQGISEIFERVVNKEIVKNKICPPIVPNSYLKKFPNIVRMIKNIESNGNYKIIVKDCSLDKGYPVVGVVLIDRSEGSYFVKFGAHPVFEIALERTLTELLQGQDINSMLGLKEFSYKSEAYNEDENLLGILVNGSGVYPTEFFGENSSYEFKEFKDMKQRSNKEFLKYLIRFIEGMGYCVFVRDVSYLGFPSFHVVVPGFSEIDKFDDIKSLSEYGDYLRIKKAIRNLDNISDNEIKEMLQCMNKIGIKGGATVVQLLNISINDERPWYYNNIDLFKAAAYYKIKDFKNSYKMFCEFFKYVQINDQDKQTYLYYRCVRDYIGIQIDDLDKQKTINILNQFYSLSMINKIIKQFEKPSNIFEYFGNIKCWNCTECPFKANCSYQNIKTVYKKLKHVYALNPIDQEKILKI